MMYFIMLLIQNCQMKKQMKIVNLELVKLRQELNNNKLNYMQDIEYSENYFENLI